MEKSFNLSSDKLCQVEFSSGFLPLKMNPLITTSTSAWFNGHWCYLVLQEPVFESPDEGELLLQPGASVIAEVVPPWQSRQIGFSHPDIVCCLIFRVNSFVIPSQTVRTFFGFNRFLHFWGFLLLMSFEFHLIMFHSFLKTLLAFYNRHCRSVC